MAACQISLSFTISQSLLKLMSIKSVMPSNHFILCCPLLLLPSIFPSIRVFSCESVLRIRRPKNWSFSFSISPSSEYSGLISLRLDWLDFLAVQGTLKSLLQHHSSKASIFWCSTFFMVQLSYPNMTTGKTVALTIWTCVWKVIPLLFFFFPFFFATLFFNWRITALQTFMVFCRTSTRISDRYTPMFAPSLTSLPSPSPSHPSRLSQSPCLSSLSHTENSTGYLFYIWFVIALLPRSERLSIPLMQSSSIVILEPMKIKVCHYFHLFPSVCHEVMGLDARILVFWVLNFKQGFWLSFFTFIKGL